MLHIAADTWGITGQTFLVLYGGLCIVWGLALLGGAHTSWGHARSRRITPATTSSHCSAAAPSWR